MSKHKVAKQLQNSSIETGESLLNHFIAMRNIVQQGKINEADLVKYIVDGLGDRHGYAAIVLLHFAELIASSIDAIPDSASF